MVEPEIPYLLEHITLSLIGITDKNIKTVMYPPNDIELIRFLQGQLHNICWVSLIKVSE
jgi:hypothetical protein